MARSHQPASRSHNPVLDKIREMAGRTSDGVLVSRVPLPSRYRQNIYEFSLFAGERKVAIISLPVPNKGRLRQMMKEIQAYLEANGQTKATPPAEGLSGTGDASDRPATGTGRLADSNSRPTPASLP